MNRYQETTTMQSMPQSGTLGDGAQLHTVEARVIVPVLAAFVTGVIVAALILILAVAFSWPNMWAWTAFSFVVGFGGWWFLQQWKLEGKLDRLIKLAEVKFQVDLPGGYPDGPPETEKRKATVDVEDYTGPYGSTEKVAVDDVDAVARIARDVIAHDYKFSYDIVNRGICTRGAMDTLRDELLNHGIIAYRNSANALEGFEVSRAGRAFFREMAK